MTAARLATAALRYPRCTVAVVLLLTGFSAFGLGRLRSVSYLEGHLPADDVEVARYRELTREFGSDQFAIFAFGCEEGAPCTDVFQPGFLSLVIALSDHAAAFSGVQEVRSLSRAGLLVGDEAGLRVSRLSEPLDPETIGRFRELVERDPLVSGALLSEDRRTTAIVVTFDPLLPDSERNQSALRLLDQIRDRADRSGTRLHASGIALRAAATDQYVRTDLGRLTPVMVGLLALFLWWVFRDAFSIGIALVAVLIPALWAFGSLGWAGRPISPMVSTMPILILVVGITDAVHFLVRIHDLRSKRDSLRDVVVDVAHEVGPPTTLTAITSALGFLSFLAGAIPNLRDFGLFSALGILGAWLTTFTLIPIAVVHLPFRTRLRSPPSFALGERVLGLVREFSWRRAPAVLAVALAATVASGFGIARIVVENDAMKLLGERDPFVQAEKFLRDHLRPMDSLEVVHRVPDGTDVSDPLVLARLERAEALLRDEVGRGPVMSLLPILRLANRESGEGTLTLPSSREGVRQLLLLAEAADPQGLSRFVTVDGRLARLSAGYAWAGGRAIEQDLRRLRQGLTEVFGNDDSYAVTGSVLLTNHLGSVILENQIRSFSTAFVTIFLAILLFVRSLSLGVLGMVPNLLPIAAILGFMGFAGVNLDVGTAMIASILIGVSVDDTIYFLMHFRRARGEGASVSDAVAYTFALAGKPALFCSAMLALGFFVLAFSSFQSLAIFGLLSGVAVLLAAISELFVMPALLAVTAGRREPR